MEKVKIKLKDFTVTKEFSSVVRAFASDVDVITARTVFDAKSIMGLFSVDLSGDDVCARIISDDPEECQKFVEAMKQFQ